MFGETGLFSLGVGGGVGRDRGGFDVLRILGFGEKEADAFSQLGATGEEIVVPIA